MNRHRPNWPAILVWGAGLATGTAFYVGLATWSWTGFAVAGTSAAVLFAALMAALAIFGGDA